MYGLLQTIYDPDKILQVEALYRDSDMNDQLLIRATVAEALKDNAPQLFSDHGSDWILCTLATHQKSAEDTLRIFQSVIRYWNGFSFGLLTESIEFKPMVQIADTCLVGLGFFRERMKWLHQQKAAPSVEYYEEAGSLAFSRTGFESIGKDFRNWTDFISDELVNK